MKLVIIFLFMSLSVNAANTYYFSTSDGLDSRTAAQAQSSATPWRSITKFNLVYDTAVAGTHFLLKAGDVWKGADYVAAMALNASGTSTKRMIIDSYGTGARPLLSGYTNLTFTTSNLPNVWVSNETGSLPVATVNLVEIGGVPGAMGRYPSSGYYIINSSSSTQITSTSLSTQPSWNGITAEVVYRPNKWSIRRGEFTGQSGSAVNFNATGVSPTNNNGMFIQNDSSTLLYQKAWYYNNNKKIKYFDNTGSAPTNVRAAFTLRALVRTNDSYITISNINFEGANDTMFVISGTNVTINDCMLNGANIAVHTDSDSTVVTNCSIINILTDALYQHSGATNMVSWFNDFHNIAMLPGMLGTRGANRDDDACAIVMREDGASIMYNRFDSLGKTAMFCYKQDNYNIGYNYGNLFDQILCDYGWCYSFNSDTSLHFNRHVFHNMVFNNGPCPRAGAATGGCSVYVFYADVGSNNIDYEDNYAENSMGGFFGHKASDIRIRRNQTNDCDTAIQINHESASSGRFAKNWVVASNTFYRRQSSKFIMVTVGMPKTGTEIDNIGKIDSNLWISPTSSNNMVRDTGTSSSGTVINFNTWRARHPYDVHSDTTTIKFATQAIEDTSIFWAKNTTLSTQTISLANKYDEVATGTHHDGGTIDVAAMSAVMLVRTGELDPAPPPANIKIRSRKIDISH